MREIRRLLAVAAVLAFAWLLAPAASAHQSPAGCGGTPPKVSFSADTLSQIESPIRDGDQLTLSARVDNSGPSACDISGLSISVRPASADETSADSFLLISNVSLSAGYGAVVTNHNPYVVNLDDSAFEAPLELSWQATIHNGSADETISGTGDGAKLTVTRPQVELRVIPSIWSGQAPLTLTNVYLLTNTSPAPAGLSAPGLVPTGSTGTRNVLTDADCQNLNYIAGDGTTDAAPVLDPGETWIFTCRKTYPVPGTYSSQPSVSGLSSADQRPWPQPDEGASLPSITVLGPDLVVDKSHQGDLLAAGPGTYSLKVTNNGNQSTSDSVTVSDALPAGLTATAISGNGWSCDLASLSCSRSDPLGTGSSYPAVTVSVMAGDNPPGNVVNTATVSGGGEPAGATANNSDEDPTVIRTPTQPNPPASSTFRVLKVTSKGDGSARIKVAVPSAGKVVADDARRPDLISRARKRTARARTVSLLVKAGPRLRKSLAASGRPRKVRVRISFIAEGSPKNQVTASAVRRITFQIAGSQ